MYPCNCVSWPIFFCNSHHIVSFFPVVFHSVFVMLYSCFNAGLFIYPNVVGVLSQSAVFEGSFRRMLHPLFKRRNKLTQ